MIQRYLIFWLLTVVCMAGQVQAALRQMEKLGRGLVAVRSSPQEIYLSWRLLGTEPEEITFNVYQSAGGKTTRLNREPILKTTDFVWGGDGAPQAGSFFVRTVLKGQEQAPSASFTMPANSPVRQYLSIPLKTPAGYTPNDASVGDLDGDGEYELVLHQAGRGRDNAA